MKFHRQALLGVALLSGLGLLTACTTGSDAPAEAPQGFTIRAGDGRVVLRWTAQAGKNYWIFGTQSSSATLDNYNNQVDPADPKRYLPSWILKDVGTPWEIDGVVNDKPHYFLLAASQGGSKVGPTVGMGVTPQPVGKVWYQSAAAGNQDLHAMAIFGGKLYAVGKGGSVQSTSDGESWTASGLSGNTTSWRDVMSDATQLLAVGPAGNLLKGVLTTTNGTTSTTWTVSTIGGGKDLNSISAGGSTYVIVGANGTVLVSTDAGANWQDKSIVNGPTLNKVAFLNGKFYAVGAAGTMLSSADGITWTNVLPSGLSSADLHDITFRPFASACPETQSDTNKDSVIVTGFVAVGKAGTVLTSRDGVAWEAPAKVTTKDLYSASYGRSASVLGGVDGTLVLGLPQYRCFANSTTSTTANLNSWNAGNVGGSYTVYDLYFTGTATSGGFGMLGVGSAGNNAISG